MRARSEPRFLIRLRQVSRPYQWPSSGRSVHLLHWTVRSCVMTSACDGKGKAPRAVFRSHMNLASMRRVSAARSAAFRVEALRQSRERILVHLVLVFNPCGWPVPCQNQAFGPFASPQTCAPCCADRGWVGHGQRWITGGTRVCSRREGREAPDRLSRGTISSSSQSGDNGAHDATSAPAFPGGETVRPRTPLGGFRGPRLSEGPMAIKLSFARPRSPPILSPVQPPRLAIPPTGASPVRKTIASRRVSTHHAAHRLETPLSVAAQTNEAEDPPSSRTNDLRLLVALAPSLCITPTHDISTTTP
ncbi:hypothetical protein NUW54_g3285 [Trametes sanguinea]|uniref:Uncharacterized protein n=1 Tax=Trametes sanguinea TaxID=158606 RepID=A0ACC1Q2T6_9APHY|nr:hypothetical protein NUW54_g3285 [Trametes sanguinea]